MGNLKFDRVQLVDMLDKGISQAEIARQFKVTPAAVCIAVKHIKTSIAKKVSAAEAASGRVNHGIDAMGQLIKINKIIDDELGWLQSRIGNTKSDEDRELIEDQQLKHVAEARKQLSLLLQIAQSLHNAEEVKRFQDSVLEVIQNVEPAVRDKIERELERRRALSGFIDWDQGYPPRQG